LLNLMKSHLIPYHIRRIFLSKLSPFCRPFNIRQLSKSSRYATAIALSLSVFIIFRVQIETEQQCSIHQIYSCQDSQTSCSSNMSSATRTKIGSIFDENRPDYENLVRVQF
jgi:hypothetical protein